ncbi:MAG: hypothetical protein FJ320_00080 [SAR202 cluster bacterium]|nr:hypothetical protein [SAR202 cluster bacterium]
MVNISTHIHNPLPRQGDARKLIHLLESLSERVGPYILESGAPVELTLQQIRALALLKRGPRNISHLAEQLGMTPLRRHQLPGPPRRQGPRAAL